MSFKHVLFSDSLPLHPFHDEVKQVISVYQEVYFPLFSSPQNVTYVEICDGRERERRRDASSSIASLSSLTSYISFRSRNSIRSWYLPLFLHHLLLSILVWFD